MSNSGYAPGPTGLYQHSAALFDIRYAQKDYAGEAARFSRLVARIHPDAKTLLDVACGTGNHLQHLRSGYRAEGLDRSPELLQIAGNRLVNVPLHLADMSDFNLGRVFDVVTCFFASIAYLGSVEALGRAVSGMAKHLSPGGLLFIEPWLTPSVYRENEVVHNFRRTPEIAVSWMYVQRRSGYVAQWDMHWLVGTSDSGVAHFVETEELSLFTAEECLAALRNAGLAVAHHKRGLHGYGAYLGRTEAWSAADLAAIDDAFTG